MRRSSIKLSNNLVVFFCSWNTFEKHLLFSFIARFPFNWMVFPFSITSFYDFSGNCRWMYTVYVYYTQCSVAVSTTDAILPVSIFFTFGHYIYAFVCAIDFKFSAFLSNLFLLFRLEFLTFVPFESGLLGKSWVFEKIEE